MARREKFREYMRKLNPVAPARELIEQGLIVDLHDSLFRKLAGRADLDSKSQQLLIGGIGSGKTTELLLTESSLREAGHTVPIYVDISSETDLSVLNSGACLAGLGLQLSVEIASETYKVTTQQEATRSAAGKKISEFAFGKTTQTWVSDYDDGPPEEDGYEPGRFITHKTPGKLKPPFPAIQRDIKQILEPLESLVKILRNRSLDVVAIFDGLDRLITPDRFWSVVHQDFRALKQMDVAVLAAAPLSVLYGDGKSIGDHFDRIHTIPTLSSDPETVHFLQSVLYRREANNLLDSSQLELVCQFSGGVLRDLITLARDAGEVAYIEGRDQINSTHVQSAANNLGASYRRGLESHQIKQLQQLVLEPYDPILSPSIDTELLVTGRILQYSPTDFRVHPALAQLIKPK